MLTGLIDALVPAKFKPYAKAVVASVGAVLVVLSTATDLPFVGSSWFAQVVAVATVLGVYKAENKPA